MKAYFSVLAIVAGTICSVSCSSDSDEIVASNTKVPMTFTVASSSNATTRTHVNNVKDQSPAVSWDKGDKIKIFEGTHKSGDDFTCTGTGEFGNIGVFGGKSYEGTSYVAVFPASTNPTFDGDKTVKITIPESQNAINNNFDPAGAIQLGRSKAGGAIDLLHVTAAFYIELEAGCQCSAITVQSGISNWALTGSLTATVTSEGNSVDPNSIQGSDKVTLINIPNEAGVYMMSFIPATSTPSLNLCITYKNRNNVIKTYTRRFQATSSFAVGNLYSLGKYGLGDDGALAIK